MKNIIDKFTNYIFIYGIFSLIISSIIHYNVGSFVISFWVFCSINLLLNIFNIYSTSLDLKETDIPDVEIYINMLVQMTCVSLVLQCFIAGCVFLD